MAKSNTIPPEIQAKVQKLVDEFNRSQPQKTPSLLQRLFKQDVSKGYVARFKGKFLYLDRSNHGRLEPICRLTWTGAMNRWDFAIYKYSRDNYDPEEWFFPGSEEVDGTVTGAMRAGLLAYPF